MARTSPKRARAQTDVTNCVMPAELEGAYPLYRSREGLDDHWQRILAPLEEPPPVSSSSARTRPSPSSSTTGSPAPEVHETEPAPRPWPICRSSATATRGPATPSRARSRRLRPASESGDAMKADSRRRRPLPRSRGLLSRVPSPQPRRRRRRPHRRGPAARGDEHRRQEGHARRDVRCVVSVAMLTEGWDANTVTHILGIRAFVPALRSRSPAVVCGASVCRERRGPLRGGVRQCYGVPFMFIGGTPPKRHPARCRRPRSGRCPAEKLITFPSSTATGPRSPTRNCGPRRPRTLHTIGPGTVPS